MPRYSNDEVESSSQEDKYSSEETKSSSQQDQYGNKTKSSSEEIKSSSEEDESSSLEDQLSNKLASSFSSLKEGEAPLPNQALGATAAARMFCYCYLSLASNKSVHPWVVFRSLAWLAAVWF